MRTEQPPTHRTTLRVTGALLIVASMVGGGLFVFIDRADRMSPPPQRQLPPDDVRIRQVLFTEIQPVALANCELERFGEERDGGYLMCGNLLGEVEAGYSYGISGYDGWGCDISTRLNVRVHQYDCFDTRSTSCPAGDLAFHAECVAGSPFVDDEQRRFNTLEQQFARNGDSIRRLVVKMDVEGAEWDALAALPGEALARIDQLVVEFHHVDQERFVDVMRRLKEHFHIANLHFNNYSCDHRLAPFPAWAYEVLLVNTRLARLAPGGGPPDASPLDRANTLTLPDCQPAPVSPPS